MDRGHRGARTSQREKERRRVQKISFVPAKNPGQRKLFLNGIVLRVGRYARNPRGFVFDQVVCAGRQDQQVLILRGLLEDAFDQALHVPANTEVLDSPQIDSNFHEWETFPAPTTNACS